MGILVFADVAEGKVTKSSLEAVTYAAKVANGASVVAVSYGNIEDAELANLGKYGASKVLVNKDVTDMDPQKLTKLVAAAADAEGSEIVYFLSRLHW